ncbi:MAG: HEAT repeat domain-containing protein [Acidobacteriota bacterium]
MKSDDKQDPKLAGLLERLHDNQAYERQRAAIELGNLGVPQAVQPLLEALEDPDDFVRNFAARSLGKLKAESAVEPLIRAIKDENLLVRRSAVESLGGIGDRRAVKPLLDAMRDGTDIMRRAAMEALGRIGAPEAIEPLIEALRDGGIYIRNGAVYALAEIGEPAIPQLVERMSDWELGPRVLEILEKDEWQPLSEKETVWFYVASRNREAIMENWSMARRVLLQSLQQEDDKKILDAVVALIGIGQDETVESLTELLEQKGTEAMAKAFVDSGKNTLEEAARAWAALNGKQFEVANQIPGVQWGDMASE